ncbi:MAG: Fic family protein, partial [Armatimonadetes bacterium]
GPLTMEQVLSLHKVLMKDLLETEKIGYFRPGTVYIVDELGDGREQLRYEGPPAKKVAFLINELLVWLVYADKDKIHPVLKAAIFHLQFATIHPFSDGNGRMSRLLSNIILCKSGWDFRKILVLEDYYNRDRLGYYNALNTIQGNHYHEGEDITSWIEYFIEGFLVEARRVADAIAMSGFGRISEEAEQIFLDKDELKVMDFISTTGRLTSNDVQEVLGIAKRTAQLKLKALVEKKLLVMEGSGPSTYYLLKG